MGRHPAVYLMGRGAIPSRRGFSRGAMRHPGVSGITRPFGRLSRGRGQVLHVLLSRSPLASTRRWVPFDLHVLGAPPAFILSQDRTLRSNQRANGPFIPCTGCRSVALSAVSEFKIRIRLVKGTKGCYVAHFVTSTLLVCLVDLIDRSIRFSRFARASPPVPWDPPAAAQG